ncbi:USP domain-containing protein [Aphis craccivora]|uniref:USP domain-containing protein n=1 Tax=Aphis craccivora TaxID=307492 RepID=A0A6G0XZB6_APHCR|nr:USP domain-containing protein [Aphis craccivora]
MYVISYIIIYLSTVDTNSIQVKLQKISQLINIQNVNYELRGIVSFSGSMSNVGHYKAVCRRLNDNWETYDDLTIKSIPVKSNVLVECEYILYTI